MHIGTLCKTDMSAKSCVSVCDDSDPRCRADPHGMAGQADSAVPRLDWDAQCTSALMGKALCNE